MHVLSFNSFIHLCFKGYFWVPWFWKLPGLLILTKRCEHTELKTWECSYTLQDCTDSFTTFTVLMFWILLFFKKHCLTIAWIWILFYNIADFPNNTYVFRLLLCYNLQNGVFEIHSENTVSWTVQLLNSFIATASFCAVETNCPTMIQSTHSEI